MADLAGVHAELTDQLGGGLLSLGWRIRRTASAFHAFCGTSVFRYGGLEINILWSLAYFLTRPFLI